MDPTYVLAIRSAAVAVARPDSDDHNLVAGHLLGNLQIFLGPDRFNSYARALKSLPELLWPVRITLLASVILHIWSSVQLAVVKSEARPVGYVRTKSISSTYASRTMYMSGPILAAFIVYHLMQFTFGVGGTPYMETDAYGNVIVGASVKLDFGSPPYRCSTSSRWACSACTCGTAWPASCSRWACIIPATRQGSKRWP